MRFAGVGDEAAVDLDGQIEAHRLLGWDRIELRTIGGVPLAELEERAFEEAARRLDRAGLQVVCVDSRIGGWARPASGDFERDLEELAALAPRLAALGTRYLRIMSYPDGGLPAAAWRRTVVERVGALADRAERAGVVLLHENCAGWAGAAPERTLELLEAVASPALKLLFDTGNGVAYGYDAPGFLATVLPWVEHVQVKDGTAEQAHEARFCWPGEGDARLAECLTMLHTAGYGGVLSIEPHLLVAPHLGRTDPGPGGIATFVEYGRRLERLWAGVTAAAEAPRARPAELFGAGDRELLLDLLGLPTAGPLEGDDRPRLWEAQRAYAAAAARVGFEVAHHAGAAPEALDRPDVPAPVRRAAARMGSAYLACQPNLVLRLGRRRGRAATVMFNVHLDTVAGAPAPAFRNGRFFGRGAIDAKGPAVALLAGVRAALEARPALAEEVCVLLQAVSGEEGGAMGVHGTRPLVEAGWTGRLNVFCEPSGLRYLDRSTAAMTARIAVRGRDAADDQPGAGHNATVLLGYLAAWSGRRLGERVGQAGGRLCVGGIGTGPLHNRVYGSGQLLLNIAYASAEEAAVIERLVEAAVRDGLARFRRGYRVVAGMERTAAEAAEVTRLEWDKRGLPALHNRDAGLEALLERAGVPRHGADADAFTCDAIWMQPTGAYTVVLGPGTLDANRAHADGEFAELAELERFAAAVARILIEFARASTREGRT